MESNVTSARDFLKKAAHEDKLSLALNEESCLFQDVFPKYDSLEKKSKFERPKNLNSLNTFFEFR